MSLHVEIYCRSAAPLRLAELIAFIVECCVLDEETLFEPNAEEPGADTGDWSDLTIHDAPGQPAFLFTRATPGGVGQAELAEEAASAVQRRCPQRADLYQRILTSPQSFTIDTEREDLSEDHWELLALIEAFLARRLDGVIYAEGDALYDADLQELCSLRGLPVDASNPIILSPSLVFSQLDARLASLGWQRDGTSLALPPILPREPELAGWTAAPHRLVYTFNPAIYLRTLAVSGPQAEQITRKVTADLPTLGEIELRRLLTRGEREQVMLGLLAAEAANRASLRPEVCAWSLSADPLLQRTAARILLAWREGEGTAKG